MSTQDIVEEHRSDEETQGAASIPDKSKEKYVVSYDNFIKWCKTRNENSFSEKVLLTYFRELSKKLKPTTLWANYSMLKSTLNIMNNINIGEYKNLLSFLKKLSIGYKANKSKVLKENEVFRFLKEAPDNKYLPAKIALILGICGGCSREELCNMTVEDIQHHGDIILINIPKINGQIQRSFTVDGEFYEYFKKYEELRPQNIPSNRFFLNISDGKWKGQPIGKNNIGKMPQEIAKYLNLPDPKSYTGHSFRRTSAKLLAASGTSTRTLKRHVAWKPSQATEEYNETSVENTTKIGSQISEAVTLATPKGSKTKKPCEPKGSETIKACEPKKIKIEFQDPLASSSEPSMNETETNESDSDEPEINENFVDHEKLSFISQVLNTERNIHLNLNNCRNITFKIYK